MKKLLILLLLTSCSKESNYLQTRVIGKTYDLWSSNLRDLPVKLKSLVRVDSLDKAESTPFILYYYCTDANGVSGWALPTSDLK